MCVTYNTMMIIIVITFMVGMLTSFIMVLKAMMKMKNK